MLKSDTVGGRILYIIACRLTCLLVLLAAEYKPILEEIERIQAEAGLDDDEIGKGQTAKAAGLGQDSRNRR